MTLWVRGRGLKLDGETVPVGNVSALNLPVLGFTLLLSLLTGAAMGAYPAMQSSRCDLIEGLKEGGRGPAGSAAQQSLRRVLVGAQVCLSVVLLAGAALLITSFMRLAKENAGFRV